MTTPTNEHGWSPRGFDPDKVIPAWRQYAIDACQFIVDDADRLRIDEPALFVAADFFLPVLKVSTGFIKANKNYRRALGDVIRDYTDYEVTNGRHEQDMEATLAMIVLYDEVASDDIPA